MSQKSREQRNRRTLLSVTRFARLMNLERAAAAMLVKNRVIRAGRGLVKVGKRVMIDPDEFERAYPFDRGARRIEQNGHRSYHQ